MNALLSKVDDVFALEQGRVLVPGIPVHIKPKSGIKIGDELELRFPDGTRKTTHVAGLLVLCGTPDEHQSQLDSRESFPRRIFR